MSRRRGGVERLLVGASAEIRGQEVVTVSYGSGRFAAEAARARPDRAVDCVFLDAFLAEQARRERDAGDGGRDAADGPAGRLRVLCQPDLPDSGPYDAAVVPAPAGAEAELTRDWLQQAYARLADRGRLVAATDDPNDRRLRGEFERFCPKPTRVASDDGVIFLGTKLGPGPKPKRFEAEFPATVAGVPLRFRTRPGIFKHRDIDQGARALADALPDDGELPAGPVLDLGCGGGAIAFVMTRKYPGREVVAADSNPRALEAVAAGIAANGLRPIETVLTADARVPGAGRFALVAGNPPYFSDFRIATLFLDSARDALRRGGVALMVTKRPDWFLEQMGRRFDGVDGVPVRHYALVWGSGRGSRRTADGR